MEMGGQRHAPADLPPGKTRYPLYRRLGGEQGRSARVRKILSPPGFDPRTVQPVASPYTNWATPAHSQDNFFYETGKCHGDWSYWSWQFLSWSGNSTHFVVPACSLPLSQQPASFQYCNPYESSTRGHRIFMEAKSCNLCRPRRVHCRLKTDTADNQN